LIRVGVDVGGTFTDFIMMDDSRRTIFTNKVSSTPSDTSEGTVGGLLELCSISNTKPSDLGLFFYGTTEATNIVVEHKGANVGMVTTKGFRDIVHIGRQKRYMTYSIQVDQPWQKHPLAKRRYRLCVNERIDAHGREVTPLDELETAQAVRELKTQGIDSIAVCFLNSYLNPSHENMAREIIKREYPEAYISLSHEVVNQYREYERFSTTCLNSYTGPIVGKHIENLKQKLASKGIGAKVMLMQSSGGTATTAWAVARPVTLLMSGPAAGLIAGIKFAELANFENIITVDVGGTTADFGVAPGGERRYKHLLDTRIKGYAAMLPMLDMDTIGAGGGSIAYIDDGGAFRVGPMSAGAFPGPACYGLGGTKATVTDAHIITKRLNPDYLLGGKLKVYPEKSAAAFREQISEKLGIGLTESAYGAIQISNHNMVQALELNVTGRGYDPRDFALMAFGGAGPLHGCELARQLSIPIVIVPPLPGITSAIGLLLSDILYTDSATIMQTSVSPKLSELQDSFETMEKGIEERLRSDGFAEDSISIQRIAECRYIGQSYELRAPFDSGKVTAKSIENLLKHFHKIHHREYAVSFEDRGIEIVHIHVVGTGKVTAFRWKKIPSGGSSPSTARKDSRQVYFEVNGKGKMISTSSYERHLLKAGNSVRGPAIVEQSDSTTVIEPGCSAKVDRYGNIIIKV
jgi:N-methylhydantoinase A